MASFEQKIASPAPRFAFLWMLFIASTIVGQGKAEDWRLGRATFYDAIHHGSCGYGGVDPNVGLGMNIAAMPDVHPDHKGSCGQCYEVKCHPMDMYDRYGSELKRSMPNVCKDPNMSIVVKIIDTCPCDHNHQWCCGDMDHFDLSRYAFERLSGQIWGVIALKYRKVSCDHDVNKTSPLQTPELSTSVDPTKKTKSSGKAKKGAKAKAAKAAAKAKAVKAAKGAKKTKKPAPVAPVEKKNTLSVYEGKFKNGFADGGLIPWVPLNAEGFSKGPGWCTNVSARRGVAMVGGATKFKGATELEFWVKESWGIPDFQISLFGKKGLFNPVKIQDLKTVSKDYGANLHLKVVSVDDFLKGSEQTLEDAHSIVFINPLDWDQGLCVDAVKIAYPL
ncbi:hypothetical protein BSKO_03636 [Bryopsis sp. KO-2023]|nr:hypothetical protein BSKO_03636 [Bryopsis sp. KO-2023]